MEQLQNWNNEIVKEQQKGDLANISKINEAIKKQNELMLSLKKIRTKNQVNSAENIDVKSLYLKLEKDKAIMVEYFSGFEKMYVFTLANHRIKLDFYWDNHTATPRIISFLNYFSDSNKITDNISGYNHYGNSLYKMLQLPTNSNYKNLIIVPDGLLNFLPFEALITKESTTTNFAKMHYLLNDFKIAYNNSAGFYLAFDKLKLTRNDKKSVLGIFPNIRKNRFRIDLFQSRNAIHKKQFRRKVFR